MARIKGSGVTPVLERLFRKTVVDENGCYLWLGSLTHNGYGEIRTPEGLRRVHRVSYELHCEPIPAGLSVLHECDVRNCWNPDHLFTGTSKENTEDMVVKGRNKFKAHLGTSNPNAKLNDDIVRSIRSDQRPLFEIASEYAIHFTTVSDIKRGKSWKHVT